MGIGGRNEEILEAALASLQRGVTAVLIYVLETESGAPRGAGTKMLMREDGSTVGTVGGGLSEAWILDQARQALRDGQSRQVERTRPGSGEGACTAAASYFLDVLLPRPRLLVIGAGHIGQAVAALGHWLGYRVAILDERAEMVSEERIPDADARLAGPLSEKLPEFPFTDQTYVVIVTPHNSPDEEALHVLCRQEMPYVGLLGGARRTRATFRRARDLGVTERFLEQIHTPIGVDIAAETPREIALSILAEVSGIHRKAS